MRCGVALDPSFFQLPGRRRRDADPEFNAQRAGICLYGYANMIIRNAMLKVQVFDPAMCCSTGVCGPSVDATLPRFAADLEWLKSKGISVERYNLAQETAAFASHPLVKATLHSQGTKSLPLILVDGRIVAQGSYPTRAQLAESVGISHEPEPIISRVKGSSPLVSIEGKSRRG